MSKIEAVSGELSTEKQEDPPGRREERREVHIDAGLRQRGAGGVTVEVLDLSTKGFRVLTHLDLQPGSDVWVKLNGLESLHAQVAWVRGNYAGCRFVSALHPAVLDMVARKSR